MNKLLEFQALHTQDELLFLPNAWDVLSALVLEQTGFKAIATTSWGIANSMGYKDGENITFENLLSLAAKIIAAVDIPVSVDIESGYADSSDQVADNVMKIAELGAVGINIEDSNKNGSGLEEKERQCQLIRKIRNKLDGQGYTDFFINARIDTYFQLKDPQRETIDRAIDYVASGANGIFVPGISQSHDIEDLVNAIDAPLNVMSLPKLTDANQLNELGVKRFSTGNALSDATTAFIELQSRQLLSLKNTESLYLNGEVKTQFR